MNSHPLPKSLKRFFWDVDFGRLDSEKRAAYVIGRILESGDEEAVRWLKKRYRREEIAQVLFQYRFVSPKSAHFWVIVLNLEREKVLCLQKHSQKIRRGHWKY